MQAPSIAADPALVNPRLLGASETAVITGVLLLLYMYRRRPYILWWMWGWVALTGATVMTTWNAPSAKLEAMVFGGAQFFRIVAGLLFVVAADAYRRPAGVTRRHALFLMPVAIWFMLSPAALGTFAVFAPGYILIAGSFGAASAAHLLLARRTRQIGATLVGVMLFLIGSMNAWFALLPGLPEGDAASRWLLIRLLLYLVTALGMQLLTFEDMTFELRQTNRRLENAQNELHQLVITDSLTGTRNRRFFEEVIGRELQRHRRYKTPLSIVFIDIDRFKAINDTMGHEAGDKVLRDVAGFLLRNIREADQVFRWGGDEFLVLISCNEQEAKQRATALQAAFAESPVVAGLPPGVGLSIGCVEVPVETTDILPLIQAADERMYADKKRRRQ